jgi:hypothetical protein
MRNNPEQPSTPQNPPALTNSFSSHHEFRGPQVRPGGILAGQGCGVAVNETDRRVEEWYAMISLRESHLPQGIRRDLLESAPYFCTIVWV